MNSRHKIVGIMEFPATITIRREGDLLVDIEGWSDGENKKLHWLVVVKGNDRFWMMIDGVDPFPHSTGRTKKEATEIAKKVPLPSVRPEMWIDLT